MFKDIDLNYYSSIHGWLKYHYGVAHKCENKDCVGKSKNYSWALIKGKSYEKKRENFFQLCYSCHAIYDTTEEKRKICRENNQNTHKTHCIRGHEFTKENTYRVKGGRMCKICSYLANKARRRRNKMKRLIRALSLLERKGEGK